MNRIKIVWKSEAFGLDAPHVAMHHTAADTYGIYAVASRNGQVVFHSVGSGSGLTRDEAITGAEKANRQMRSYGDNRS